MKGTYNGTQTEDDGFYLDLAENDREIESAELVLNTIESELARTRTLGVSKASIVAVESVRPGTFDKKIIAMASVNHTRTNYDRTIVALEDARTKGNMLLIGALIAGMVMLLKWILDGSVGGSGDKADVEGNKEKYNKAVEDAKAIDELADFGGLPNVFITALKSVLPKLKNANFDASKMMAVISELGPLKTDQKVHAYIEMMVFHGHPNPLVHILTEGYEDRSKITAAITTGFQKLLKTIPHTSADTLESTPLRPALDDGTLRIPSNATILKDVSGISESIRVIYKAVTDMMATRNTDKTTQIDAGIQVVLAKAELDNVASGFVRTIANGDKDNYMPIGSNIEVLNGKAIVSPSAHRALSTVMGNLNTKDQLTVISALVSLMPNKALPVAYRKLPDTVKSLLDSVEMAQRGIKRLANDPEHYEELVAPLENRNGLTKNIYIVDTLKFCRLVMQSVSGLKQAIKDHNAANGLKEVKK